MRFFLALTTLLAANVCWAGEAVKPPPAAFNGAWQTSQQECTASATPILLIGKNVFKFHGNAGKLRAVVADTPKEVAFIAEITDEDGQKWLRTFHYKLSDNGQTMKDAADDPELAQALVKCRAKK